MGKILEIPDAGVGDDDVETSETRNRVIDEFLVRFVAADVGLEGFDARAVLPRFLLNQSGGVFGFVVGEDDVGARLRKHFYGCGADPARASSDNCRLACQ